MGLALVLLLLGCSSSHAAGAPRPSPSATPSAGLAAGWTLHADKAAGFAVAFPDTWVQAMRDSPTLGDDLATITVQQADLGQFFTTAFTSSKATGLVLLAADPASLTSGFTTNATVFLNDLGPAARAPDLEAITKGKLAALHKDSSISGTIDRRNVQLGGMQASRIAYVFKSKGMGVEVTSYLVVVDRGQNRFEYELTIGSAIADYARLFARVASSFALTSRKTPSTPSPVASLNPAGPGPVTPSP